MPNKKNIYILAINAYHADASAALIRDGVPVATVEEERFKRIKHWAGFPSESIKYCLDTAGISISDIEYIAIPRNPGTRLLKKAFYGLKIPALAKQRIFAWKKTFDVKRELSLIFGIAASQIKAEVVKVEHHRAHLASSFFVSGFNKAFLLSADALGDFASTAWAIGEAGKIRFLDEITFPHSLGFFYTAITQYLGFLKFGDEYKIMGLAPYGEATFKDEFDRILKSRKNKFELNLNYFLHHKKHVNMNFDNGYPEMDHMFSSYLEKRLGKRRKPEDPIEQRHKDIAFCAQRKLEETLIHLLKSNAPQAITNLCLSGGVAHNCAVNGKIFEKTHFKKVYVPPAPGDAGLAVGAALYLWNQTLGRKRDFAMNHAYWGPGFDDKEIQTEINANKEKLNSVEKIKDQNCLCKTIAQEIKDGKIVGWFQGRMELGPRALGNRSILADPRRKEMKDTLNKRIKRRESFRPFAPSVLEEDTKEYFERSHPSPFMSFVYKLREDKQDVIPAVCHIDKTARLQTVNKEENPLYWQLIKEFKDITGIPIILNTSFNENEPIVCFPKEAIKCFLRTKMDILALGSYVIKKEKKYEKNSSNRSRRLYRPSSC